MTIRFFCDGCSMDLGENEPPREFRVTDCNNDPTVAVSVKNGALHYCKLCMVIEAVKAFERSQRAKRGEPSAGGCL